MPTRKRPITRRLWEQPFLEALANTGNLRRSCQIANVDRSTVFKLRQRDADFAARYDDAVDQAMDVLEAEAMRRAIQGTEREKWVRSGTEVRQVGEGANARHVTVPIYQRIVEKEYSDVLLMFVLKGYRPERFRDSFDLKGLLANAAVQSQVPAPVGDKGTPKAGGRGTSD